MSKAQAAAVLAVLAGSGPGVVAAPPTPGGLVVEGFVVDVTGAGVPGARVTLRREAHFLEAQDRTDGAGRFRLTAPARGEYDLLAAADGFSVASTRVVLPGDDARAVRLTLAPGVFSEQITVLGTQVAGGPETLRRIPGSVDIIGPAALLDARVFTTSEALRKAAGVNVRDEEGFGLRPNIGLRGLNPTRSAKLLLLEDGLPLAFAPYGDNATYYHPPIERFESVEVLKGSGQLAYGPVTVGGVVNYITPGPPTRPGGTIRLAGGNRDYFNGHAQGGGTWGRTGLLIDYLHKRGDGARQNVHSRLHDANVKALVSVGSEHALVLKGSVYDEASQVTYSGLREDEYRADPRQNPFHNDAFDGRRYGASVRHNWLLGRETLLVTQVYASRFSRDWWRQSSNSGQRPNDAADPKCAGMANLDTTCGNEGRLRDYGLFGLEPRLRVGHRLFGVASEAEAGVRAHFEWQERRQENGDAPRARQGVRVEDNRRETEAYSAFLQNRVLLGRLIVTPGVRFERIDYERTNRLANQGAGATGHAALSQWVPGLGLAWAVTDRVSLFAGAHRGFAPRAPRTSSATREESWTSSPSGAGTTGWASGACRGRASASTPRCSARTTRTRSSPRRWREESAPP